MKSKLLLCMAVASLAFAASAVAAQAPAEPGHAPAMEAVQSDAPSMTASPAEDLAKGGLSVDADLALKIALGAGLMAGMVSLNVKPTEVVAFVGGVQPVSQGVGSVSTGWIDATKFHRYMAMVHAGVLGAAATLDAKIEQATTAGGAGVKDVVGKAIVQLTKAGADDGKNVVINFHPAQDLDVDGGFGFFRVTLTVAAAASLVSAAVYGVAPQYGPASDNDASTVDEIVA